MSRSLRAPLLCVAIPLAISSVLSLLLRTEPAALLAALSGPFAGLLFGHSDCTFVTVAPAWSALGGASLLIAVFTSVRLHASPRAAARRASHALLALATSHWALLGLLSVANTLS